MEFLESFICMSISLSCDTSYHTMACNLGQKEVKNAYFLYTNDYHSNGHDLSITISTHQLFIHCFHENSKENTSEFWVKHEKMFIRLCIDSYNVRSKIRTLRILSLEKAPYIIHVIALFKMNLRMIYNTKYKYKYIVI